MLVAGIVFVPLLSGLGFAAKINIFTAVREDVSTQAVVMIVPAAGEVLKLFAVFGDKGTVIAALVTLTVSASTALMVTVPFGGLSCATAGTEAIPAATNSSAPIPKIVTLSIIFLLPIIKECLVYYISNRGKTIYAIVVNHLKILMLRSSLRFPSAE